MPGKHSPLGCTFPSSKARVLSLPYSNLCGVYASSSDSVALPCSYSREAVGWGLELCWYLYQPCLLFAIFCALTSRALVRFPRASQFLEEVNNQPRAYIISKCRPTNPEHVLLLLGSWTLEQYPPAQSLQDRVPGTCGRPMPQSLLERFLPASSMPISSWEDHANPSTILCLLGTLCPDLPLALDVSQYITSFLHHSYFCACVSHNL